MPNNEISKVAICEACYRKEKAVAEIPEDLRARLCTYRGWKERIDDIGRKFEASPVLKQLTNDGIELIERIASLTEQLRLSKAAYETNLATAEHNKRVAVNELNAEIRALTEENERLKQSLSGTVDTLTIWSRKKYVDEDGYQPMWNPTLRNLRNLLAARTQEGDATK